MAKHSTFLFLVSLLLLVSSCGNDGRAFDEVRMPAEFTIPPGLNTIEAHFFVLKGVPTFYEQNLQVFGLAKDNVVNIQAAKGQILQTSSDIDLDFISSITIDVVSRTNPNERAEMYYNEQIPLTQGANLRMLSATSELKDLLSEELVDLEVRLTFRRFPPTTVRCDLDLGYAIFSEI